MEGQRPRLELLPAAQARPGGEEIVLQVIKNFIDEYVPHDISRARPWGKDNTIHIKLISRRAILHLFPLEQEDKRAIIIELLMRGKKAKITVDSQKVYITGDGLDRIWEMMWTKLELTKYCYRAIPGKQLIFEYYQLPAP